LSRGWLLDTSVLSMLAPGRPAPRAEWVDWLRAQAGRLYPSAVTIAQIEQGVCKLRRTGGGDRADRLTAWLDAVLAEFADRVLALDGRVGRRAGAVSDRALAVGQHPGFADMAIAATAAAHDLILLTRNARRFAPLGNACIDPEDGPPRPTPKDRGPRRDCCRPGFTADGQRAAVAREAACPTPRSRRREPPRQPLDCHRCLRSVPSPIYPVRTTGRRLAAGTRRARLEASLRVGL
jgi:predicted nucleic acid-binding protein